MLHVIAQSSNDLCCLGKGLPVDEKHKPIPELIIRENMKSTENSTFTFYFMKEKKAFTTADFAMKYMDLFHPEKVWWLIEPGNTISPVPKSDTIPIFATVSPDPIRYKEFAKTAAKKLFMKTYTLNELLAIGRHMRPHISPVKLQALYTDAEIEKRFEQYGGIIRRVLPADLYDSTEFKRQLETAVSDSGTGNANISSLIHSQWHSDKLSTLGSYLVQWEPIVKYRISDLDEPTNEDEIDDINFADYRCKFASPHIYELLVNHFGQMSYGELKSFLKKCSKNKNENGFSWSSGFETYVLKSFVRKDIDALKDF